MAAQHDPDAPITHPLHILKQSAKAGSICAVPGFIVGSLFGTLKSKTPRIFALVATGQWFVTGTTFWAIRSSILEDRGLRNWWRMTRGLPLLPRPEPLSKLDRVKASTISGLITGPLVGAVLRGRQNIIPGAIMFTIFGYSGQHLYEFFDKRNTKEMERQRRMKKYGETDKNWMEWLAEKKWTPFEKITDQQHEKILEEQIFKVEVDIALIDDRIKECREQQKLKELEKAQAQTKPDEKAT